MSNVTTVGIDLAKNVFSVHGVDSRGNVAQAEHARVLELVAGSERAQPHRFAVS